MAYYTDKSKTYQGNFSGFGDTPTTWLRAKYTTGTYFYTTAGDTQHGRLKVTDNVTWFQVLSSQSISGTTWYNVMHGSKSKWVPDSADIEVKQSADSNPPPAPTGPTGPSGQAPKSVVLSSPMNGATVSSPVTLDVTSKDAIDYNFQILDSNGNSKLTRSNKIGMLVVTLDSGTYKWSVVASNSAGTVTSPTWSFTVSKAQVNQPQLPNQAGITGSLKKQHQGSVLPWILGGIGAVLVGGTAYVIIKKRRTMTPKHAVNQLAQQQAAMSSSPNKLPSQPTFPPGAKRIF